MVRRFRTAALAGLFLSLPAVVRAQTAVSPAGQDSSRPASALVLDSVVPAARLLVLAIHDSGERQSVLRYVVRDAFLDLLIHDTLPKPVVLGGLDTLQASNALEADSLARRLRVAEVVWMTLRHEPDGGLRLLGQRRNPWRDSLLAVVSVSLPDTGEKTLAGVPRILLWGLWPRALPPRPALSDSLKPAVVLPFLPEGTATDAHARLFTDSLSSRLERLGFRVLPRRQRDSLLGRWDPGECLTESCRHEVADRLGVPWIVSGHLSQLGDKWGVRAALVLADSAVVGRQAVAQGQGAPAPSLDLVLGQTARQLAGQEAPRSEFNDAPIARQPSGPAWMRLLALGVAATLGAIGMFLSW